MAHAHEDSRSHSVRLGRNGRIVVPAQVRRRLGIEEGSNLVLTESADGFSVYSHAAQMHRIQDRFAHLRQPGFSIVDELEKERRAEARREWPDNP